VAIVDLDLQFGDVGLALGLPPERTVYDLVRSGGSLDAEKLSDFLVPHPSGVRALLGPVRPDHAALVTPEFLRVVLRILREMHDFVVVDTPPGFTPEVIGAIDASTNILMVGARDALALKNTKIALETLSRMEYDPARIRMLLNRANSDVGIESRDLLDILGREVDVRLPSHREIARSVNRGEPIALQRRSEAGKVFHELARFYVGTVEERDVPGVNSKRRQSLFQRRR
jgi:pilus assembly protein CpaE